MSMTRMSGWPSRAWSHRASTSNRLSSARDAGATTRSATVASSAASLMPALSSHRLSSERTTHRRLPGYAGEKGRRHDDRVQARDANGMCLLPRAHDESHDADGAQAPDQGHAAGRADERPHDDAQEAAETASPRGGA